MRAGGMQGIEADADNLEPRVTLESDNATVRSHGVQRAADAASTVARALSAAGYEPRHLSVTSSETGELVLVARLEELARPEQHPATAEASAPPPPAARPSHTPVLIRLAIGLTLGVLLGFLGLPRVELPVVTAPAAVPTPLVSQLQSVQELAAANPPPTPLPPPTPTAAPTLPSVSGPLFNQPLTSPIPGWPNNPQATAWFAPDGYRLLARDAGQFVAVRIPIARPVQGVKLSATFHKAGGPPGGGYGFIVRDQSPAADRDGRNQFGEYLVVEVGDRGDVGIWQRDQTHWIDVVPWEHSTAVHLDRLPNAIVVTAEGSRIQFEVNGETVADLNYTKLPAVGGVGLFVGGDLNEVTLEQLRIDTTR